MDTNLDPIAARRQLLADQCNCVTEDDLALLAGVKGSTLDAWRRRRQGPTFIRFGNTFLYPKPGLLEHLESLSQARPSIASRLL